MKKLHELKEKLLDSLMEYNSIGKFSNTDVETIKNLISSILKICEYLIKYDEEGYSNRDSYGRYSYDDNSYGDMSNEGRSYARNGRGRGRYAERDSRGRYSSEGYSRHDEDMLDKLHSMMNEMPPETRSDMKRLIDKMEAM